ncbi:MAG: hypothetical protein Q8942_14520 [Bacillota bacterium]|nr:hypothetical protein [Bacillota bacterium]
MKINKLKASILIILTSTVLIIAGIYINYINLDLYTIKQNGDIVAKDGSIYTFDCKLTSDFAGGDLKVEKMIGRIYGESFFGGRIYKLKGIDNKSSIALNKLMLQEVHTNQNKN